jgi:4-amino-4-deoxy-L-arabinose transferase-like glycosyltransferase
VKETHLALRAQQRERALDVLIFAGLFAVYLAWLLVSAKELGYTRDEGFYFHAAQTYGRWFDLLRVDPARALQPLIIDKYWQENHEHPALMKSLFWAAQHFLEGPVFKARGTAYRFPAMFISALAVSTIFAWGRRSLGRAAGIVAALSFALMPAVFFHSHLSCFDSPIAAMWLFTAYAYFRSLHSTGYGWPIASALLYGLCLNTKFNAGFLPAALVVHAGAFIASRWNVERGLRRFRPLLVLMLMGLVGPLIFYATWPWIWHQTSARLLEYLKFHLQHVYYNMEFLGQTYFEPPFPRSYAWLMTLATVPAITLVTCALGLCVLGCRQWAAGPGWARFKLGACAAAPGATPDGGRGWASLWLLCILVSYAPWLSNRTPIFGGTKHWLTAYPFVALFAGQGFAWLCEVVRAEWAAASRARQAILPWVLGACILIAPLAITWHSRIWGLSAYTPLVGGAPGAASLGLNRSFWGYTTGAVVDYLNGAAAPGDRVFLHDTVLDSFHMLQKDGRLRRDLKPWWTVAGSRFALYHHEQHMSRVEHMIWVDYGSVRPAHIATFDGVPMVWVYERQAPNAKP